MDIEITTLSEVGQRKTNIWYSLYVVYKNDTNVLTYKA